MSKSYQELLQTPPAPPPRPLSDAEKAGLDVFRVYFRSGYMLDGVSLTEREMMWMSQDNLLRYLEKEHGVTSEAIHKLEATLRWRRRLELDNVDQHAALAEVEIRHKTRYLVGYHDGCPMIYWFYNRNPLTKKERRMEHNIYMLERAIDMMPAGVGQVVTVLSFRGKRMGPSKPMMGLTKEVNRIIGVHYPGVTRMTFLQDLPPIVRGFLSTVWPFVDSKVRETLKLKQASQAVHDGELEAEDLIKECGGALDVSLSGGEIWRNLASVRLAQAWHAAWNEALTLQFEYDHETYWPLLLRTCKARRAKQLEQWRQLGDPQVGRAEWLFK